MDARRPFLLDWRQPAFWLYALVVILWIVSLCVHNEARFLTRIVTLLVLIAAVLVSFQAVRSLLRDMPRFHRLGLAVFFAAFLLGHFFDGGRATFPFVPWRMFGSNPIAKQSVEHVEIHGVTADNHSLIINAERLFPSLGMGTTRLYMKLRSTTRAALRAQQQTPEAARIRDYNNLLLAIGHAFNRHADQPATQLNVVRVCAHLDRTRATQREIIWKVKLP